MTATDIVATLEQQFGDRIKSKKLDAIDPFVVVDAPDLLDVCRFLRDDPRLAFDMLNCISGVDYLEPDPKKAPKAGFEPHMEVVYHLSELHASAPLRHQGDIAALEGQQARRIARSAVGDITVEDRRVARTRGLRPFRRLVHRPSRFDPHPARRRLGRASVAEGL